MRILSEAIKTVLAQDYAETKDVVIISMPEQNLATYYPATTLYLANGEGVFLDGVAYENKLRNISSMKFSLGKAPDNATIVIENVSRSLGFPLTDFRRSLDGAKVVIKRAFKLATGEWETDTMFVGYVREVKIDQSEINITINSDMSRRGNTVAGIPLTQRCILRFNKYGSGVGEECGWLASQPGNPASCDKGLDTPNGCQSHGNQHRYGGIPPFTALDLGNGYVGSSGGWGSGSGGGWCVALDSWVLVGMSGKRIWRRAYELVKGDYVVSIDKFGRFVESKVMNATVGNSSTLHTVSTKAGYILDSSPTHCIMKDYTYNEGLPVNGFAIGDEVLSYNFEGNHHFKDSIASVQSVDRSTLVLLLELETPYHLYMATSSKKGAIVSHNLKPAMTEPSVYTGLGGGHTSGWGTGGSGTGFPDLN